MPSLLGPTTAVVDVSMGSPIEDNLAPLPQTEGQFVGRALEEPDWKVEDYYKTKGVCQAVARNGAFKGIMTALNTVFLVWMGVEADFNASPTLGHANPIFVIIASLSFVVFSSDVLIRILAFKRKADILKRDQLVVFEVILTLNLLLYMILGGAIGGDPEGGLKVVLQLCWLSQLLRVARLAANVPELGILLKGMVVAARSVFFTLMVLCLVLYVFAVCLVHFTGNSPLKDRYFSTVPSAEWTLLIHLTFFSGIGPFFEDVKEESLALAFFLIVALLIIASLIFMGIGVLLEVVSTVAKKEKDILVCKYLVESSKSIIRITMGEECLNAGMTQIQTDKLFLNMQFVQFLTGCFQQLSLFSTTAMGLDLVDLKDLVNMQFEMGKNKIMHKELMSLVVELTGPNAVTMRSMLKLRQSMDKQKQQ